MTLADRDIDLALILPDKTAARRRIFYRFSLERRPIPTCFSRDEQQRLPFPRLLQSHVNLVQEKETSDGILNCSLLPQYSNGANDPFGRDRLRHINLYLR